MDSTVSISHSSPSVLSYAPVFGEGMCAGMDLQTGARVRVYMRVFEGGGRGRSQSNYGFYMGWPGSCRRYLRGLRRIREPVAPTHPL